MYIYIYTGIYIYIQVYIIHILQMKQITYYFNILFNGDTVLDIFSRLSSRITFHTYDIDIATNQKMYPIFVCM